MKKADIALNTMLVILIAVISIIMLIGFFSQLFPSFGKTVYCNTLFLVQKQSFIPQEMRAEQSFCQENPTTKKIYLEQDIDVNISILSTISACWEQSEKGKRSDGILCFEIIVGNFITTPVHINETEITDILIENNMCNVLPNNDIISSSGELCGSENKIIWNLGQEIYPNQNILIEYDRTNHQIIIT